MMRGQKCVKKWFENTTQWLPQKNSITSKWRTRKTASKSRKKLGNRLENKLNCTPKRKAKFETLCAERTRGPRKSANNRERCITLHTPSKMKPKPRARSLRSFHLQFNPIEVTSISCRLQLLAARKPFERKTGLTLNVS